MKYFGPTKGMTITSSNNSSNSSRKMKLILVAELREQWKSGWQGSRSARNGLLGFLDSVLDRGRMFEHSSERGRMPEMENFCQLHNVWQPSLSPGKLSFSVQPSTCQIVPLPKVLSSLSHSAVRSWYHFTTKKWHLGLKYLLTAEWGLEFYHFSWMGWALG